jgi:hypothetical protein
VYYDAAMRHLASFWEGNDTDPDSGGNLPHIIKAMACLLVLRDSQMMGNWIDDRPPRLPDGLDLRKLNGKASEIIDNYPDAAEPFTHTSDVDPDRSKCGIDSDQQIDWLSLSHEVHRTTTVPQPEPKVDLVALLRVIDGVQTDPSRLLPKPKTCGDCLYWEAKKGVPGSGCLSCPGANITDVACKTFHPKEGE